MRKTKAPRRVLAYLLHIIPTIPIIMRRIEKKINQRLKRIPLKKKLGQIKQAIRKSKPNNNEKMYSNLWLFSDASCGVCR